MDFSPYWLLDNDNAAATNIIATKSKDVYALRNFLSILVCAVLEADTFIFISVFVLDFEATVKCQHGFIG